MSGIPDPLFPEFEKFVNDSGLLTRAKGILSAKLPRILGQGKTKANGLDLPPSVIERKMELINLELPEDLSVPGNVVEEISHIRNEVEASLKIFSDEDAMRRFLSQVMASLPDPKGYRDSRFFADRLIIVTDRKRRMFDWTIASHYPVVSRIPPDLEYINNAFHAAKYILEEITAPPDVFEKRLIRSWQMARGGSDTDEVLIGEVAKMYLIAGQSDQFWKAPRRRFFEDLPPAAFVASLLDWRRNAPHGRDLFEFVPATLNQEPKFYMPVNPEGTQTKPYIYMKMIR